MKNFLLILIIISLIVLPVSNVESDVASELRNMFDSIGMDAVSSSAGVYQSQARGYAVGGSFTARAPTKYISPMTIQLPNMKSGCGGIDMFFGGFQFINAEEFKKFLQAAGTAAIGYAFHMALQAVCPTCDETLKALRKFADDINRFGLSSCTAGKMLAGLGQPLYGALEQARASEGKLTSSDGTSEGFWSPVKGFLVTSSAGIKDLHQKMYEASRDPKALLRSGISTADNLRTGIELTEDQIELAISLLGTKASVRGFDEGGEEITTAECREFMPLIKVSDILESATTEKPFLTYKCGGGGSFLDNTCEYLKKTQSTTYEGYRESVRKRLIGIKDKIIEGTRLNDVEINFVRAVPNVPIITTLKAALAASPEMVEVVIVNISDLVAISYAMYVVNAYVTIYKNNAIKHTCGDIPVDRYVKVMKDFMDEFQKYTSSLETTTKLIAFINSLQQSTTSYTSQRLRVAMRELGW